VLQQGVERAADPVVDRRYVRPHLIGAIGRVTVPVPVGSDHVLEAIRAVAADLAAADPGPRDR
jgi:hypothetical protein